MQGNGCNDMPSSSVEQGKKCGMLLLFLDGYHVCALAFGFIGSYLGNAYLLLRLGGVVDCVRCVRAIHKFPSFLHTLLANQ